MNLHPDTMIHLAGSAVADAHVEAERARMARAAKAQRREIRHAARAAARTSPPVALVWRRRPEGVVTELSTS